MRTEAWAFLVLLCFSFQGKEVEKKKKAKNARSPYGLCMGAVCPRCYHGGEGHHLAQLTDLGCILPLCHPLGCKLLVWRSIHLSDSL